MGPNILVSRAWPYKVTWRHRSYDQSISNMLFPIGVPLELSLYRQLFSRYLHPNKSGSRPGPLRITWHHQSHDHLIPQVPFPMCSIVTVSLSPAIFETMDPKHIGVTTLTFRGHGTSSVTWPIASPYAVSYWCPIGTEPLSIQYITSQPTTDNTTLFYRSLSLFHIGCLSFPIVHFIEQS